MFYRIFIFFMITAFCTAGKTVGQSKVCIIKGVDKRVRGNFSSEMTVYGVQEGNMIKVASVPMDSTHSFMLAVPVKEEGFYYLKDRTGWWLVTIYLKPGDKVELNINKDKGWELVYGSEENKIMHDWSVISEPATHMLYENTAYISNKAISFKDFLENYTSVKPVVTAFVQKEQSNNPVFDGWFKLFAQEQMELSAYKIMSTPILTKIDPVTHKTIEDSSNSKLPKPQYYLPFYKPFVEDKKFCDARILHFADALNMILYYRVIKAKYMSEDEKKGFLTQKLEDQLNIYCNDTIKGLYLLTKLSQYRSYDAMKEAINPVEKYFITDHMKEVYAAKQKAMYKSWLLKAAPAMAFKMQDNHGKTFTMDDFKGKLVYVDIWATWCAPCKAELPYLKKTVEKFKDKNIAFVSVTIDKEKDKKKWMDMIENEHLVGTQLFGGEGSEFQKFYNAFSIPRFLLIDADGKIISVNASRPSDPTLEKQLNVLLSSNN